MRGLQNSIHSHMISSSKDPSGVTRSSLKEIFFLRDIVFEYSRTKSKSVGDNPNFLSYVKLKDVLRALKIFAVLDYTILFNSLRFKLTPQLI